MSTSTEIKHPLPEGTKVRVAREPAPEWSAGVGVELTVDYYISEAEADDGVAFYVGSAAGGYGNVEVPPDVIDVVMTTEQLDARSLPTMDAIRRYIGDLSGNVDGFEMDSSERVGDNLVALSGTTDDGLDFTVTVEVRSITLDDL